MMNGVVVPTHIVDPGSDLLNISNFKNVFGFDCTSQVQEDTETNNWILVWELETVFQ